jgi:hypothetical protein
MHVDHVASPFLQAGYPHTEVQATLFTRVRGNHHFRKFGVASDRVNSLQDLERGMAAPLRGPNAATW